VSFFGWLFSKPIYASPLGQVAYGAMHPSSMPHPSTHPLSDVPGTLSDLKQQRHDRREHLYGVIRSVMLRSEVLAANYKFKVLSLDTRGRQFLVMIDLMAEGALPADRWGPVEQLIAITAAQRHELQVKAVYWRLAVNSTHQSVPQTAAAVPSAAVVTPVVAELTTLEPKAQDLTEQDATPVVAVKQKNRNGAFEPIGQEEVLAFKQAISTVAPADAVALEKGKVITSGPKYTQPTLTGYEDTQILEPDDAVSPLSRTQFGDL